MVEPEEQPLCATAARGPKEPVPNGQEYFAGIRMLTVANSGSCLLSAWPWAIC